MKAVKYLYVIDFSCLSFFIGKTLKKFLIGTFLTDSTFTRIYDKTELNPYNTKNGTYDNNLIKIIPTLNHIIKKRSLLLSYTFSKNNQ